MTHPIQVDAIERAIATLIAQFIETPDLLLSPSDARCALYGHLLQHEALSTCYVTRDGHHTHLVHCDYPADTQGSVIESPYYDLALLTPAFLRGHDLEVVANVAPPSAHKPDADGNGPQPAPLMALINLALLDRHSVDPLDAVEERYELLENAEHLASLRYLLVLYRHWEQSTVVQLTGLLGELQHADPHCRSVLVQSYHDDMGQVSAGRYRGPWIHQIPLAPIDSQRSPWQRHGWRPT